MNLSLGDMLRAAGADREPSKPIDPEAAIMRLREAAERYFDMYNNGPRFKVGDVITPFADSCFVGAGEPYIVIYAEKQFVHDTFNGSAKPGTSAYKQWQDVRVLSIKEGDYLPVWAESADFEFWKAP